MTEPVLDEAFWKAQVLLSVDQPLDVVLIPGSDETSVVTAQIDNIWAMYRDTSRGSFELQYQKTRLELLRRLLNFYRKSIDTQVDDRERKAQQLFENLATMIKDAREDTKALEQVITARRRGRPQVAQILRTAPIMPSDTAQARSDLAQAADANGRDLRGDPYLP